SPAKGSVRSCTTSFKLHLEAEVSVFTELQSWNLVVSSSKDPPEDNLFFLAVQLLSSSAVLLTLTDLGKNMLQYT
ncbi:hypothetical protein N334_06289, partial [Pelecanus crispus]